MVHSPTTGYDYDTMHALKRGFVAAVLVMVLSPAAFAPVAACSPPDTPPERTARADVIIEGWIEGVAARPDLPSGFRLDDRFGRPAPDPLVPVEIAVRVTHVHRGNVSGHVTVPYQAVRRPDGSAAHLPDGTLDFGTVLPCRDLHTDPTGKYALLVLSQNDGQYRIVHAAGSGFYGDDQDLRLQEDRTYIADVLSASLPSSADGTPRAGQQQDSPP